MSSVGHWTTDPGTADLVIYPVPPWPDPQAPQRFSCCRPDLWSRIFLFSQADDPVPWAPGVFASASSKTPEVAGLRGGFYVYPTHYSEPEFAAALEPRPNEERRFLWTFVGSVASCPAVRRPLMALADERALTIDTTADTAMWNRRWEFEGAERIERNRVLALYADSLHQTKFVVCPRGVGSSSVRLFEAMRAGRCPVIVSDEWVPPPFVDWASCAIRLSSTELPQLPAVLKERECDAAELGNRARTVWEQRYSPPAMLNTLVEACLDIGPEQCQLRPRLRMARRAARRRATARAAKAYVMRTLDR